jgi:hypothetical protein
MELRRSMLDFVGSEGVGSSFQPSLDVVEEAHDDESFELSREEAFGRMSSDSNCSFSHAMQKKYTHNRNGDAGRK